MKSVFQQDGRLVFLMFTVTTCLFKCIHSQDVITDPSLKEKKPIYVPLHSPLTQFPRVLGQVCFVKTQVTVGHQKGVKVSAPFPSYSASKHRRSIFFFFWPHVPRDFVCTTRTFLIVSVAGERHHYNILYVRRVCVFYRSG